MTDRAGARAKKLYQRAVALPVPERSAFLEENCDDAAVRVEVERLLDGRAADGGSRTAEVLPPIASAEDSLEVSAPGRGDLSRVVRSVSSSASSYAFDHGRFLPGTVVSGRYRVVGLLGIGGMGEVYRADDLELGQSVALKFLPDRLAKDRRSLDRFRNEVRLARQVSHPNVCRVYDIGQVDGHWFLSMEYVDGEDLSLLLRRIGRFPKDRAVEVARQLCLGLEAAHEKGVLHRDLKPANVMVDGRGKILITDFGLAEFAEAVDTADVRSGTPQYMAPEQLVGREVTRQSDIYSLGLVLHEVFTGRPVWEADSLADLVRKREYSSGQTPSSHVDDLDPAVGTAIHSCLEADPKNRPRSALSVAAALPGGDPLAAARAAGETPSPEVVAAAGGGGGLRPVVAGGLVTAFAVGVVLILMSPRAGELSSQLPERPEFLARDAQDVLLTLGLRDPENPPLGTAYGFWEVPGSASRVEFWYRESPEFLHPTRRLENRVRVDDPPLTVPGMVTLRLDGGGGLRELRAVPDAEWSEAPDADGSRATRQWDTLFRLAALEGRELSEVPDREWIPPVYADALWNWEAQDPKGDPCRVHAATCRGEPVFFEVVTSGAGTSAAGEAETAYDVDFYRTMTSTIFLIVVLAAVPLARRNLIRGRSDRRGAFRLGMFFFVATMAAWVLGSSHVPDVGVGLRTILLGLMVSVWQGMSTWIFYIALEPYVRRLWPESLITWSRLLAGRVRNASVGRDILIGGAFFSGWALLGFTRTIVESWTGVPRDPRPDLALVSLTGGRFLFSQMLLVLVEAVGTSVFFLIFLLMLRVMLRKEWLAIGAFSLVWSLVWVQGRNPTAWILAPPFFACVAYVLTRYGLVACIAAIFFLYVLIRLPTTLDTTVWYWDASLYGILLIAATAAYGLWTALASRARSPERPAF